MKTRKGRTGPLRCSEWKRLTDEIGLTGGEGWNEGSKQKVPGVRDRGTWTGLRGTGTGGRRKKSLISLSKTDRGETTTTYEERSDWRMSVKRDTNYRNARSD